MLHFDSKKFFDEEDESFVSIDLNDDVSECDICHQSTTEPIVNVVLSDEFLRFEGSHHRHNGMTKAHQICLDKWSEIIQRNLKFVKQVDNNNAYKNLCETRKKKDNIHGIVNMEICDDCNLSSRKKSQNNIVGFSHLSSTKELSQENLSQLSIKELRDLVFQLEREVKETSSTLVMTLQTRDQLSQEISVQHSTISQLVQLQRNPCKKMTRCAKTNLQEISTKLTITV